MRIEGEVISNLTIGDLNEGDVFIIENATRLFMKTDDRDVNVVGLNDGELMWIDEDTKIQPVNGKFVIAGC